jgi:ribosomal-protein-alanine N-acetyltransferase
MPVHGRTEDLLATGQVRMVIETERLILREFKLSDLDDFSAVMADPLVMRFSITGPWDRDRTRRFLEGCLVDYSEDRWGFGRWATIHKQDNRLIGFSGLARYDDVDGSSEVEIGYRLLPEYWGGGLGTESAQASRDFGFGHLRLTRLISMIQPGNLASVRVAEKIGMVCEKEIHKWDQRILVYAVSAEEVS